MIRLKICCIASLSEARLAIVAGADALGLVGPMPSGPGVIDDAVSAEIARLVPPPIATFLLTSETTADALIIHARRVRPTALQLVDAVESGVYAQLRQALPGIKLIQVLHVDDERTLDKALTAAPHVDALLLDSGNPNLAVKELGGTGRVHKLAGQSAHRGKRTCARISGRWPTPRQRTPSHRNGPSVWPRRVQRGQNQRRVGRAEIGGIYAVGEWIE